MSNQLTVAQAKDVLNAMIEATDQIGKEAQYNMAFGFQVFSLDNLSLAETLTALRKAKHALSEFKDDAVIQLIAGVSEHSTLEKELMAKTREIHEAKVKVKNEIQAPEKKIYVPEHLAGESKPIAEGQAPAPAEVLTTEAKCKG